MPKISIVTPTFNSIKYIRNCVESVRYALNDVDYEHVLADRGSTDGTVEYLQSQTDLKVVVKKDKGMYEGLNNAIEAAQGIIIGYLNSDEQYNRNGILKALARFDEDSNTDVVFGPTIMVNNQLEFIQLFKQIVVPRVVDTYWCMPVQSASLLYKRSLWERAPYDTNYRIVADHAWFRKQMEWGINLKLSPTPIGIFTWHPECISNTYGKTDPEDALSDINKKSFSLKIAKHIYRIKKLLLGGYIKNPIDYEIYKKNKIQSVHINKPALKVSLKELS